jgi:lysophospholipase L1-like esterase
MLVVNMSNNDADMKTFGSNLKEFVNINGAHVKTVFVLEANSPETGTNIEEKHIVMKQVAEELDVPIIDLHSYLSSQNNTGILWWDKVHLTAYGHFLSAQYLSKHIEMILQNEKKDY